MVLNKHSCHSAGDWLSSSVTEAGKEGQGEAGLLGPWARVWMKLKGEPVRATKGCKCTLTNRQFLLNKICFIRYGDGQAV